MQNAATLLKIAKRHVHLHKKHEDAELVELIIEAEPEITEKEAEEVVALIEIVAEETAAAAPEAPMENNLKQIAKKYAKLPKKSHEDLVTVIAAAEPDLTEAEVEEIVTLVEVIAEETGSTDATPDPLDNEQELIDMPEDGLCPAGFEPTSDGMQCAKVSDVDAHEDDILPLNEDETCPDGYRVSDTGDTCVKADAVPEAEAILNSLFSQKRWASMSNELKLKTIKAAYKRSHIAPCGCAYLKTHKNYTKSTHSKNPKPYQLKHKFDWAVPIELDKKSFKEMQLVKGVAMTSGIAKRGENMTDENVTFGAGAMSAAAMFGMAVCDIDHYEDKLPHSYEEKYGEKINDPYPVAVILDAAAEKYTDEITGEEHVAVEFLASVTNPLVYSMIKEGKFKGCSVVDFYRKENCSACDGMTGSCNCSIDGSHFLVNTFVLEGVPNAHATWVSDVTEKDIGTIINIPDENTLKLNATKMKSNAFLQAKHKFLELAKKQHGLMMLEEYLNEDGSFIDGKQGIVKYLADEKQLSGKIANDMADYIIEHKGALSNDQLEFMSASDLNAWWVNSIANIAKQKSQHMTDLMKTLVSRSHADLLGKESVNYREGDGANSCATCRLYTPMMDFNTGAILPTGFCQIVNGDITGTDTCDRHETIEGAAPAENPAPEPVVEESTLDNTILAKYSQKKKHSTVMIDRAGGKDHLKTGVYTQKAIEKIKKQPVFFAKGGARVMGENLSKINSLKKKNTIG